MSSVMFVTLIAKANQKIITDMENITKFVNLPKYQRPEGVFLVMCDPPMNEL
jgi:hypothetical protein